MRLLPLCLLVLLVSVSAVDLKKRLRRTNVNVVMETDRVYDYAEAHGEQSTELNDRLQANVDVDVDAQLQAQMEASTEHHSEEMNQLWEAFQAQSQSESAVENEVSTGTIHATCREKVGTKDNFIEKVPVKWLNDRDWDISLFNKHITGQTCTYLSAEFNKNTVGALNPARLSNDDRCLLVLNMGMNKETGCYKVRAIDLKKCQSVNHDTCLPACKTEPEDHIYHEICKSSQPGSDLTKFEKVAQKSQQQSLKNYLNFNMHLEQMHRDVPCTNVAPLVDGHNYFTQLSTSLLNAKKLIAIAGWKLQPNIRLNRTPNAKIVTLLDHLEDRLAAGVNVYVMLWRGVRSLEKLSSMVEAVHTDVVEKMFKTLQQKTGTGRGTLRLVTHPFTFDSTIGFSHHGKYVVIDEGAEAFLGGIDIATDPTRYDTTEHTVVDAQDTATMDLRADKDINGKGPLTPLQQAFDQKCWHDVQIHIRDAPLAKQVWRLFLLRWFSYSKKLDYWDQPFPTGEPELMKLMTDTFLQPATTGYLAKDLLDKGTNTCSLQFSLGRWSGLPRGWQPDQSVLRSWDALISGAKKYIYIEQQYFISRGGALDSTNNVAFTDLGGDDGKDIINDLSIRLLDRINYAIKTGDKKFKVIIVCPWEADSNAHVSMRRTIRFFTNSVNLLLGAPVDSGSRAYEQYVQFYGLRSWKVKQAGLKKMLLTTGIYVHDKMMIVDDERAIVGSANINDRSFMGDRDHEAAIVYNNPAFATELRKQLWSEHLGVAKTALPDTAEAGIAEFKRLGDAAMKCYTTAFQNVAPHAGAAAKAQRFQYFEVAELTTPLEAVCTNNGKAFTNKIIDYPYDLFVQDRGVDVVTAGDKLTTWTTLAEQDAQIDERQNEEMNEINDINEEY